MLKYFYTFKFNILSTKSYIKILINKLTFFELFLVLFTIFISVMFILTMVEDYIISLHISNIDHINYFWGDACAGGPSEAASSTETVNPSSSSNTINSSQNTQTNAAISGSTNTIVKYKVKTPDFGSKFTDGAIMTAALTGGSKLAQHNPTVAGKLGVLVWSVGIGTAAIIGKNIAGNISSDLGKQSKQILPLSNDLYDKLETMFNLTGNNGLDLLNLIQYFQKLQLFLIMLICYNLLLLNINEDRVENLLLKILPSKIIKLYIKSVRILKKSGFIIIICLLILLLISNLYSYYYLDFFISNLDGIIKLYFSK